MDDGARLYARMYRHPGVVCLHRSSCAVRGADRACVFRLGRDLFALPVDLDRYVWAEICRDELWLPVYRAGGRFDSWRPGRGILEAAYRQLDRGLHNRRMPRHHHRIAGGDGTEGDADAAHPAELSG